MSELLTNTLILSQTVRILSCRHLVDLLTECNRMQQMEHKRCSMYQHHTLGALGFYDSYSGQANSQCKACMANRKCHIASLNAYHANPDDIAICNKTCQEALLCKMQHKSKAISRMHACTNDLAISKHCRGSVKRHKQVPGVFVLAA